MEWAAAASWRSKQRESVFIVSSTLTSEGTDVGFLSKTNQVFLFKEKAIHNAIMAMLVKEREAYINT